VDGQGTGGLAGHVRDASTGRPVAAEVALDGARRIRADDQGAFRFDGVLTGRRAVRVRYPGYAPRELTVDVTDGRVASLNVALDQAIIPLGAVVVTAARREQRLADAIVETELIAARELRRSGASDVAGAITERAGIQLDGGVPAGAGAQIRGFDSRRILVLLDGQPMIGRLNGNFDLSRLPLTSVERIEVVKGPQSTLYGSDAMGGVINIITRRPPEENALTGTLASTLGSAGRREVSAEAGWRRSNLSAVTSGGHRGIDLAPGVSGDQGTFARRWDGLATVRYEPDSSHRYEAGAVLVGERQRYSTGQLFHFGDNTQIASHLSGVTPLGGGRLTSTISLSRFEHLSRASTGGAPVSDSGARDLQTLLHGSALYSALVGPGAVDAGIDVRQEMIDADRVQGETSQIRAFEPFVQYAWTVGGVQLSPGMRLTASDRWGQFLAPRIAAMWRPRPALALRGTVGRGFRAPDFKELYYDFVNSSAGYAVRGNPDLKAEASTSVSLGVEWDGAALYAHVAAFANGYRNFIEFREPDAAGVYTYGNISRGRTTGLEAEGGIFVRSWRVDASGAWMQTRDNATGLPLLGRPASTLRLTADGPLPLGLHTALSGSWIGRTAIDRSAAGGTTERPSFARVDVRLVRSLPGNLEAAAGVTNLLDRGLGVAWPGFTGRQLYLSMTWRSSGNL
jgi:outer membrane receptor for ferrienterochelin and colicins